MNKNKSRQAILFMGSIILIVILSIFLANSPVKGAVNPPEKHYITITIDANDTLWDIANQYANTDYYEINEFIEEVVMINAIIDNKIYTGNKLMLPVVK